MNELLISFDVNTSALSGEAKRDRKMQDNGNALSRLFRHKHALPLRSIQRFLLAALHKSIPQDRLYRITAKKSWEFCGFCFVLSRVKTQERMSLSAEVRLARAVFLADLAQDPGGRLGDQGTFFLSFLGWPESL